MSDRDIISTTNFFFEWIYLRLEDHGLVVGRKHLEDNQSEIRIGAKHYCDYDCGCDFDQWSLEEAMNHYKGRKVMIEWIFGKYEIAKQNQEEDS